MKLEMMEEEIKPTGDGANDERQEPSDLRQLDAAVAERVMGWSGFMADGCIGYPSGDDPNHVLPSMVPPYSARTEAAMQVVEKLGQRGFQASMVYGRRIGTRVEDNDRAWWVAFADLSCNEVSAEADTLPEAICRAAIALVDGNQETK